MSMSAAAIVVAAVEEALRTAKPRPYMGAITATSAAAGAVHALQLAGVISMKLTEECGVSAAVRKKAASSHSSASTLSPKNAYESLAMSPSTVKSASMASSSELCDEEQEAYWPSPIQMCNEEDRRLVTEKHDVVEAVGRVSAGNIVKPLEYDISPDGGLVDTSASSSSQATSISAEKTTVNIRLTSVDGSVAAEGTPFRIRGDAKLDWLKSAIKRKTGMYKEFQSLFLDGNHLSDGDKRLCELGVTNGVSICLKASPSRQGESIR